MSGSTGLLTLAWFLQRQSKKHEENEKTYENVLKKVTDLLQEQYNQHIRDPQTQPWLAISHIRDKIIPEEDRFVFFVYILFHIFIILSNRERLKNIWERVKKQISQQDSRIRSETQKIQGEVLDVWRWIKSAASSPKKNRMVRREIFLLKIQMRISLDRNLQNIQMKIMMVIYHLKLV